MLSCTNLLQLIIYLHFFNPVKVKCDSVDSDNKTLLSCHLLVKDALDLYPNYENFKTPDLIAFHGYPVETHTIKTEDGYILTAFRIPYSNKSEKAEGKVPVYLMHGILSSSAQWFWQPPDRALVFMLADAGFDVWIGNARGTTYSRGHESLSSTKDSFTFPYWDFSHHEMGKYDLNAVVNYITTLTGQPSLYYIGHSLGTTQFFSGVSVRPEISSKIRTAFSLSTSVFQGRTINLTFRALSPMYSQYLFQKVANKIGKGQFLNVILEKVITELNSFCDVEAIDCKLCFNIFSFIFGFNLQQTNLTMLPGFLAHVPDTTSSKSMSHVMQQIKYGTFRQYDYGALENLRYYGSFTPPDYDLKNVQLPVVIFYSEKDTIAMPVDVMETARALGNNVKEVVAIPIRKWTHMDFVLGIDADIYVYNPIIQIMKNETYG